MKKIIALLIVLMFNINCSSDSDSSTPACTPIPCLNGGTSNANCGCDCPQGYSGANCSTQIMPTIIKITKIKVKYFPNLDNGSTWDSSFPIAANAPADIYVALQNSNNVVLYTSPNYFANVLSNGTNTWDFIPSTPISVTFIYFNSLKIKLYDFDGADSNLNFVGGSELMRESIFNIYGSTGSFPTTLSLLDTPNQIGYEFTVQYVW